MGGSAAETDVPCCRQLGTAAASVLALLAAAALPCGLAVAALRHTIKPWGCCVWEHLTEAQDVGKVEGLQGLLDVPLDQARPVAAQCLPQHGEVRSLLVGRHGLEPLLEALQGLGGVAGDVGVRGCVWVNTPTWSHIVYNGPSMAALDKDDDLAHGV